LIPTATQTSKLNTANRQCWHTMCRAVAVFVETTYSLCYVTSDELKATQKVLHARIKRHIKKKKMHQAKGSFTKRTIFADSTLYFKLSVDNNLIINTLSS
jgi:hypothetical protein